MLGVYDFFVLVAGALHLSLVEVGEIPRSTNRRWEGLSRGVYGGSNTQLPLLKPIIDASGPDVNTAYHPGSVPSPSACKGCSGNGFCPSGGNSSSSCCACFSGYTAPISSASTPAPCMGPAWATTTSAAAASPAGTVKTVPSSGADGGDPAIWIHPTDASQPRTIATTKSAQGAGLSVYDLAGNKVSSIYAGEPNNVDVIYNFPFRKPSRRPIKISRNGTSPLPLPGGGGGGSQPTKNGNKVYGSCTYTSPTTGKVCLFANAKTAEYLQYELFVTPEGGLATTLVRSFVAGNGGQVEGCVADDRNAVVFIGGEPYGLWKYPAEPEANIHTRVLVDSVDGDLFADVEGVTLVHGRTKNQGYIIVSCQGVSAFNIYDQFRRTMTVGKSVDGSVDAVTNTDGVAAVGTRVNRDFPSGLMVVHDDVNQNLDGTRNAEAAFKLVSLAAVLLGLEEVDAEWSSYENSSVKL
ncbi:hypothetical protein FN846DRAFT_894176 [Sphaerosporella brunnea]|uniref:BPP domain-containing protein n=1 Tax=Sphaerosporella brunnea TaxID=1250544 RepID=A0A5J5EJQ4_9PEZI|nr:hypothetical protein FN846DRAFT_894176 [Sphaerosporella brunnea]